jgi:hypothetical protein
MKCLEHGFCLTELEEEETGEERAHSAKNDKSDGKHSEIECGDVKMNNKGSGRINSDESEQDDEEYTSRNSSSGNDAKEEKQKKNADLKMLTRSLHSILSGSITQPSTPLRSKKILAQNVKNGVSLSSSKYSLFLFIC